MKPLPVLLAEVRRKGLKIWLEGHELQWDASDAKVTTEDLDEMRARAADVISLLRQVRRSSGKYPSPVPRGSGLVPMSLAQERLWFLEQLMPMGSANTMSATYRVDGPLDVEVLYGSITEIVRRHEVLRTRFSTEDGQGMQQVCDRAQLPFELVDLSHLPGEEVVEACGAILLKQECCSFDLSTGAPFRVCVVRLARDSHILTMSMHHMVSDGWSLAITAKELGVLYSALLSGERSPLPEPELQYADYAVWHRRWVEQEAVASQLAYWRQQLSGLQQLRLHPDRIRPRMPSFRGATVQVAFARDALAGLQALSREEGTTLYMALLAVFQLLLSRWTGQEDITVGSPVAGRTQPQLENLIGFFVNTLVLRTQVRGRECFRDLLRRVREVTLAAYAHQDVPFEKLVAALQPQRDLSHQPLFQVLFALQNFPQALPESSGLAWQHVPSVRTAVQFDLALHLRVDGATLSGYLEYATDLFDRETIERLLGHYEMLLKSVTADPDAPLGSLQMLTAAEYRQVVVEWNATREPYRRDACVHQLFREQARRTPDATALIFEDQRLSYAQLDQRSNQLANHLHSLGVGPEVVVGLCVEQSFDLVIGLLGVLKAGAAYLPLDPNYPRERLTYMLHDAGARILLTKQHQLAQLPAEYRDSSVCIDSQWSIIARQSVAAPDCRAGPKNLIYVIYTSGSTGKPKGAANTHAGVVNLLAWYSCGPLRMLPEERLLLASSVSFDLTQKNILGALVTGAALVIPAGAALDRDSFRAALGRSRPTRLNCAPSALRMLMEDCALGSVRTVVLGGEFIDAGLVEHLARNRVQLVNSYGPTECADVAAFCVANSTATAKSPSIGRPIPNVKIYLLDPDLNPVPVGVVGELYIGGDGVGRGYINRPGLTAERFLADPYDRAGARIYRTGDLARYLPDGNIELIGRIDFQVKLRGLRIELSEIEAALLAHPAVKQAVVVMREEEPGCPRLFGYVVGPPQSASAEMRAHLRRQLPEYMVPAGLVFLKQLPLTPNGKLDRDALPVPSDWRELRKCDAPRGALETKLAEIWAAVLKVDKVGVHDNFFDVGGDSLLGMRVLARVREAFGINVPTRAVVMTPTIAQFCAIYLSQSPGATGGPDDSGDPLTYTTGVL